MRQKQRLRGAKQNLKKPGEIWNLEPILNGKSFDELLNSAKSKTEKFKKYREMLSDNITPLKLLEIIRLNEDIHIIHGRLMSYYMLKFYADTRDSKALAKMSLLKQVGADIGNDMLFFSLWFIHLDDKTANRLISAPELRPYSYYLKSIRLAKPYTKSEEIERILNIKDITGLDAYADIYNIITSGYMFEWDKKQLSKEEVVSYFNCPYPKLRQRAYDTVLAKYKDNSTVLAEIYKNIATDWCSEGIKIRGYKSSISIRNLDYDVSDKSVDVLLNAVRKNAVLFNRYFRLKYSLNKKGGQKYPYSRYHLYAPFKARNEKKYPYSDSKSMVLDTYKKFDQRFYDNALKIFDEKHVHSHPAEGKRGGAFCQSITRDLTPYVLLNHTDRLRDLFTMMHELGHGIHDLLAGEKQVDAERHASLAICETASVFSEMILADRLLKESDDAEEKKHILVQLLDNQYATIIRQAYFVIFEKYAHEEILKGATKESLDEQYYKLLKEQFGGMDVPDVFRHEWTYIPHIYETPFYCYAYAWGNLFVVALYDMYRKEGKSFIEKYVKLLSAGGSDSPINLMKMLGVDAESEEFWQRGFNIIAGEIDELERLGKM